MSQESHNYSAWLGKSRTRDGAISLEHAQAVAATLNRSPQSIHADDPLPPLWHWCFLQEPVMQSQLARDGHAQRGDFLPPITLPRRMWAGSRITFHKPILIANDASKTSTIENITHKQGKTGELFFVTVKHSISQGKTLCLEEEQDIVYRSAPSGIQNTAQQRLTELAPDAEFSQQMTADPILLFRYSAITFNAHRIHYDRAYASSEENYPGLLVHGPLLATLLMELFESRVQQATELDEFTFRALSPVYDLTPFLLCGNSSGDLYSLWISDESGAVYLSAQAKVKP